MHERASELRQLFLEFFRARDHRVVPSSPLIPVGDPTLLFTTAGMVQFKPLYGAAEPEYTRAASIQKCMRATDIDQIGHTIRHHTFFEMLGNFSFGDYFKREAIRWAWEFVREKVALDLSRVWVSVHESDDEAAQLWERETDMPAGRIVRLGDKDNFWGPAGATGACGPSSELYWDLGPAADPGGREGALGESDRYIEFWNLVFPQFHQDATGRRTPLARPGIDTGMGFERLCMIAQEAGSTYETDVLMPIVSRILELAALPAMPADERKVAVRIIADHARALAFTIAGGVVPGNEGRGYVVRRLLRRAARRGRGLGLHAPFLHHVTQAVVETYAENYPELRAMEEGILGVTRAEEERFARTLDAGMERFSAIVHERRAAGATQISGADVFQLYDTFGFPADLTAEMAEENGLAIDRAGFDKAMDEQRARARKAHKFQAARTGSGSGSPWMLASEGSDSEFRGYETQTLEAAVRRFRAGAAPGEVDVVLDQTPFYAEAGGQVGDTGILEGDAVAIQVVDTVGEARAEDEPGGRVHVHRGRFLRGGLADLEALGSEGRVMARVDADRRAAIMRNHTATHLLHAALREIVGTHVQQAGSLVAPDRLRFDFTHYAPLTPEQIEGIESKVNAEILRNTPVEMREETYDEARTRGAIALFGEKYGRDVRTIGVPGFSLELCGGTHCRGTGDIGLFKIVSEGTIGAGMRRLEAVTGLGSLELTRGLDRWRGELGQLLGVSASQVTDRIRSLLKENAELKQRLKGTVGGDLEKQLEEAIRQAENAGGHRLLAVPITVDSVDVLREAGDQLRQRLRSGAAVLAAVLAGKVTFLAVVTDDLIAQAGLRADELVREVAAVAGGSGGGKPHQAMGSGGKNVELVAPALERGREILRERLKAVAKP